MNDALTENQPASTITPAGPHTVTCEEALKYLQSTHHGLTIKEATERLERYGHNTLPQPEPPGIGSVFLHQFTSPLIYVLVAAALLSILIEEWSDAGFIVAVLLINAIIGTSQEFSAQRAATALNKLVTSRCRVLREGDAYEIDSEQLVPGDILFLESGDRIPADIRILSTNDLEIDESLLTGESTAVLKDASALHGSDTTIGDRSNMAFAGTLVNRGRGEGLVVATAFATELGRLAQAVLGKQPPKAPLLVRMERFTHRVAIIVGIAALIMAAVAFSRGMILSDIFLLAVALAVSVIPEGLPVALTVALAVGMSRMAKRHVIIRRLVAVEALGSCTYIVTDKTGTLTVNQLTVRQIIFPFSSEPWEITGEGTIPEGDVTAPNSIPQKENKILIQRLCQAAILPNDGFLGRRDQGWTSHGDAVDVALLVMAHKAGFIKAEVLDENPELASIPFESERLFSASLNSNGNAQYMYAKGAWEQLLPMCTYMATPDGDVPIDPQLLETRGSSLARCGFRVLAVAAGEHTLKPGEVFSEEHLTGLTLIGFVAMIDPLRPEAREAIALSLNAGIKVAMVTGDHPATAYSIAKELGLAEHENQIVTGPELKKAVKSGSIDQLTKKVPVFARVEPYQKLDIVKSLQRNGHFVAVSGDGANDAPALRAAQVGVAMGKSGTDVARETADIIITDDNFLSLVSGIEEGRTAYANVRKVIFLLISTGAAELVLFTLALFTGQPLPLLAVQLLWLNLVTNGIQDVALAFEPAEGNELNKPPRSPQESIFNRLMIERVVVSAVVIGCLAFLLFQFLLSTGASIEQARNETLLLMVLFENIHVFNSRSETLSAFRHNPFRNPILLIGTAAAQLIHIGAMYTPWINDVLQIQPVAFMRWLELLGIAMIVLVAMEIHKVMKTRILNSI